MAHESFLKSYAFSALLALTLSCGSRDGDPPSPEVEPPPNGKAHSIHEIANPDSPLKAVSPSTVDISGAAVVAVDAFDETGDGKSAGTIYVADVGSQEPYSGISLYRPTFNPSTLRVAAGDVLDMRGTFQENQSLPIPFAPGAFLVQIADPLASLRFDGRNDSTMPQPIKIDINELSQYTSGRKWLNMLVTVENVTIERDAFSAAGGPGRISAGLLPDPNAGGTPPACTDPFPKVPTMTNELMDIAALQLPKGTVIKKLTGLVVFFCNLHIAPRSPADIVL